MKMSLATLLAAICALSLLVFARPAASQAAARRCNGFEELCDKPLSDVAFAVTHNAYAVGTSIASNQNLPIAQQLADGIRGFKLTVMRNPNGDDPQQIRLCHGQCGDNVIFADAGPLVDTLRRFREFLRSNPSEVIAIFVDNQKSIDAADIMADFTSSGLASLCYAHTDDANPWPTLATMIRSNKRVVVFVDRVVRPGSSDVSQSVDWFMAELGFVAANFWLQTTDAWTCRQHQPYDANSRNLISRNLFLLHHYMYNNVSATVQIPAKNKVDNTNSVQSIQDHVNLCFSEEARPQVNFVSVDYYEKVDYAVLRVVDALNGVQREAYGSGELQATTATTTTSATRTAAAGTSASTTTSGSGVTETPGALTRNPPKSRADRLAATGLLAFVGSVVALFI